MMVSGEKHTGNVLVKKRMT